MYIGLKVQDFRVEDLTAQGDFGAERFGKQPLSHDLESQCLVAHNFGLLPMSYGLLWGIVAPGFGLLGFLGKVFP